MSLRIHTVDENGGFNFGEQWKNSPKLTPSKIIHYTVCDVYMLVIIIAASSHTTTALIRRFPGFTVAYGGGKIAEMKFQPSKICQQFMNKQFDEVKTV